MRTTMFSYSSIKLHALARIFLCACLLSSLNGYPQQPAYPNTPTLRVMTYNIHHANPPSAAGVIDIDTIAAVIKKQQPDLVAVQEVDVFTGRSGNIDEASELAARLNMYVYFGKAINYDGGQYGVALLSKFPLKDCKTYPLPSAADTTAEPRVLAVATVQLPGGNTLRFGSTHLDVKSAGNRDLQVQEIVRIVRQEPLPFILAGDLNAQPSSSCIQLLDAHLTRTCSPCAPTIPVHQPNRTIDYIAYYPSKAYEIISHEVIPERYASDHLPVLAVLSMRFHAETALILQRYRSWLTNTEVVPDITHYLNTFDSSAQWRDIDYQDQQLANWQVSQHLLRVRALALAWTRQDSYWYRNIRVKQFMFDALQHWLQKRYHSNNWWHNKIGVPQLMRDIVIVLRPYMDSATLRSALEVMAQYGNWQTHTGANLTWSADLALHYGALTGNDSIIRHAVQKLVSEIKMSTGEGIQPDYSFHQHNQRLQIYHYGRAFLYDNVRLAWELQGTQWQLPAEKIQLLADFVLQGWQWMARGKHTVPGTLDRSVSRPHALHAADIMKLIPYLSAIDSANAPQFIAIAESQEKNNASVAGFRYFPCADFAAYHTPAFSFFLKTISSRTLPTESINNENLKGRLLHSGDAYLVRDGKEYYDLMPVWDWNLLPGVTVFPGAAAAARLPWVGGVSNGMSGAAVMDYQLTDEKGGSLTAKKAWFCHNERVICLMAGLTQRNIVGPMQTAIDQCRWVSNVTVDGDQELTDEGEYTFENVRWLYHAGIGYVFLQPSSVSVRMKKITGNWSDINASIKLPPVREKVFTPVLQHKQHTVNTGYVVTMATTPAAVATISRKPDWTILRNDTLCQAVQWKDGTQMFVFHTKGSAEIQNKKKITVDKPCMLLITKDSIYGSNPAGKEEVVTVAINKKSVRLTLPANGFSAFLKRSP
jgi:chondroitin AC lyase